MDDPWKALNLGKLLHDADREAEPRIEALRAQVVKQLGQVPHQNRMRTAEYARLMEQSLREGTLHPQLEHRVWHEGCCGMPHLLHAKRVLRDLAG